MTKIRVHQWQNDVSYPFFAFIANHLDLFDKVVLLQIYSMHLLRRIIGNIVMAYLNPYQSS